MVGSDIVESWISTASFVKQAVIFNEAEVVKLLHVFVRYDGEDPSEYPTIAAPSTATKENTHTIIAFTEIFMINKF